MAATPSKGSAANAFSYSSFLPKAYYAQLERLMFFNPGQLRAERGIIEAIDRFGVPQIRQEGDRLRIGLDGDETVQSLFACLENERRPLVGMLTYTRTAPDRLVVLHMSLHEDYAANGRHADRLLLVRLIGRLRQTAARIKGVRYLEMFTAAGVPTQIRI